MNSPRKWTRPIRREMDVGQDDPGRRASRRLFETAYTRSPYRFTIIGYPDIFNEASEARRHHRNYYHEKYAPNNCFYVVASDIKNDDVIAQIKTAYSKTQSPRHCPPVVLPLEPKQTAPARNRRGSDGRASAISMSRGTSPKCATRTVLHLLDAVLSMVTGRRLPQFSASSSRCSRERQERRASRGRLDPHSPGLPGIFGMSAIVDGDKFIAARDAMLAEIEKLKVNVVSADELHKAVKRLLFLTPAVLPQDHGRPGAKSRRQLARSHGFKFLRALPRRRQKRVTLADIQRVSRYYLTEENRTLYALLPEGAAPKAKTENTASKRVRSKKLSCPLA